MANLYELENRVFTESWSIPYKREESLGKCLAAATRLAHEGKSLPLKCTPFHFLTRQECVPVGCVPPACCPYLPGCTAPGGCTCPGSVPGWEGVPVQGVYLPKGGVPAWGVYLPGGCTCLGTPPREQNSCHTLLKILPCPKLRLRAVTS